MVNVGDRVLVIDGGVWHHQAGVVRNKYPL